MKFLIEKSIVYTCDFFFNNKSLCKCDIFFSNCQRGKHTVLVWAQNYQAGYKMTQLTESKTT